MKAQELRIGNIVNILGENREILGISKYNYKMGTETIPYYIEFKGLLPMKLIHLKPIPLTEQWLIDFGFTKYTWCDDCAFIPFLFGQSLYCRYYNDKWHIKTVKIRKDKEGYYCDSQPKNIVNKGLIKHVHQLQNLYHGLTGKELTKK